MQKYCSCLCFQATLTTAGLVVVSTDVIIHVILWKNRKTGLRRPFISLNGWIPPRGRLSSPCMPRATCSGFLGHKAWMHYTPSMLWQQPTQGLDYPLQHQPGNEALWAPKERCSGIFPEADAGLAISPCSVETNTTLAFPWPAWPSSPTQGTQINLGFILTGWTKGTSTDRPTAAAHWHPQVTSFPTGERETPCMILMRNSLPR